MSNVTALDAIRLADFVLDRKSGVHVLPGSGRDFGYADGGEKYLLKALPTIADRSVGSEQLRALMKDWASLYHLTPYRSTILDALGLTRLGEARVLELGCGCGAITRWLGETGAEVHAVEGSGHRAAVARARTADLDNVSLYTANYSGLAERDAFDLVTLIGVLEYSHLYHPLYEGQPERAAVANLVTAANALRDNGVLVIAIENRMGLKYLNGAHEDHSGRFFEGIEGYPHPDSVVTFNRRRLEALCAEAGFDHVEVLVPYPDYKLARQIVNPARIDDDDRIYNWMHEVAPGRGRHRNFTPFSESLAVRETVQAGLLTDLANSHLALAFVGDPAAACERLGLDLDWSARHYALDRRRGLRKRITLADGVVGCDVRPLAEDEAEAERARAALAAFGLRFRATAEPQRRGDLLTYSVLESVVAEGFGPRFEAHLRAYRTWLIDTHGLDERASLPLVSGDAFDSSWSNIVVDADSGEWQLIDREWELVLPIPVDYVLWRTLVWFFRGHLVQLRRLQGEDVDELVRRSLAAAGCRVSDRLVNAFARAEAAIQRAIAPGPLPEGPCAELESLARIAQAPRRFSILAFAEEAVENPTLLAAYADRFNPGDDVTLVLYAPDADEADMGAAVENALRVCGEAYPDVMLLVDGSERARRVVAADADVLFSDRARNGAFGLLPRVGVDDAASLRSHADAAWA